MRCLVTGASGFVGSWLVRRLLSDGHSVAVVTRSTSNLWRIRSLIPALVQIEGDLSCLGPSRSAIQAFQPEVVFHLAWSGGNSSRFLNDAAQVYANVPGSLELIRMTAEAGATTFINFGSCVEYGQYCIPVRETDPVRPKNLYGSAKYAVEQLGLALAPVLGLRFVSLRLFWAYGPSDDDARLVPSLVRKLLAGERQAMTRGDQIWDYLYIDDVIEAVILVAKIPSAEGVFNLGSGRPERLRTVAEQLANLAGSAALLGLGDVPYGADQVMHLQADISRLRAATGWEPRVGLNEGLERTVAWYKGESVNAANR